MKFKGLKPKKKPEPSGIADSKNDFFKPPINIVPDSPALRVNTNEESKFGSLAPPKEPQPDTKLSPLSVFPESVRI